MLAFKWTGILIAVVTVALDGTANLILDTLTTVDVPQVLNLMAIGLVVVGVLVAFIAHLQDRTERDLDHFIDLVLARVDELEVRIGDRNSGFVEGYLLGHDGSTGGTHDGGTGSAHDGGTGTSDAPVLPFTPRVPRRVTSVDD